MGGLCQGVPPPFYAFFVKFLHIRRLKVSFAQGFTPSTKRFAFGGRIVIKHKLTFTPFKSFLSDGEAKNECGTRVSLHLLEGEGDRAPRAHGGRGKYGSQTYSYAAQEFPLG